MKVRSTKVTVEELIAFAELVANRLLNHEFNADTHDILMHATFRQGGLCLDPADFPHPEDTSNG